MKVLKFRLMESTPGTEGSTSPTPPSSTSSSSNSNSDSSGAEFDFADLASHDESDPLPSSSSEGGAASVASPPAQPAASAPQPAAAVSAPPAPAAAPPSPPVAPQPAAPAASATQGQPPGQSPAAAPQAPATPTESAIPTREQITQTFAQHREKYMPELIKLYAFDPQRDAAAIEELRTDPATALPKLAANLHYEVQLSTYNSVMQAIPEIIGTILDRRREVDTLETEFRGMYPELHSKPEYQAAAESSIRAMRAANPQMDMREVLKRAGIMAMLTLGLPIPGQGGAPSPTPSAPAAPPVRIPPPGRPAGVGASGASPMTSPAAGGEGNIFEDLFDASRRGEI